MEFNEQNKLTNRHIDTENRLTAVSGVEVGRGLGEKVKGLRKKNPKPHRQQ